MWGLMPGQVVPDACYCARRPSLGGGIKSAGKRVMDEGRDN